MKQKQYSPQSVAEMGLVLFVANEGFLDDVDVAKVVAFEAALLDYFNSSTQRCAMRSTSQAITTTILAKLKACVESFKSSRTY